LLSLASQLQELSIFGGSVVLLSAKISERSALKNRLNALGIDVHLGFNLGEGVAVSCVLVEDGLLKDKSCYDTASSEISNESHADTAIFLFEHAIGEGKVNNTFLESDVSKCPVEHLLQIKSKSF
jgi:hypothetical protein